MVEDRRAGKHPSKVLTEVGKERHACHGVRCKIQKTEAEGAHDIVEEIRERGAEPARKVIDEEGYRFGPALAKSAGMMSVAGCPIVFLPHRGLK